MSWWMKLIISKKIRDLLAKTKPFIPDLDVIEDKLKFKMKFGRRNRTVRVKYSIVKGDPNKVIHHFHGFMGSEKDFYKPGTYSTAGWVAVYPLLKKPRPTIISYSHDSSWLMSPIEDRKKGDRDATVLSSSTVLLMIENKHGIVPKKRIVTGTSMGGFNAVTRWMYSGQYDAACFHVPLMSPPGEIKGIASWLILGQFKLAEWLKINPLGLDGLGFNLPPVHMQYSKLDQFGFYKPDQAFEALMRKKNVDLEVTENEGDHADMNPMAMAEFINRHLEGNGRA